MLATNCQRYFERHSTQVLQRNKRSVSGRIAPDASFQMPEASVVDLRSITNSMTTRLAPPFDLGLVVRPWRCGRLVAVVTVGWAIVRHVGASL